MTIHNTLPEELPWEPDETMNELRERYPPLLRMNNVWLESGIVPESNRMIGWYELFLRRPTAVWLFCENNIAWPWSRVNVMFSRLIF